MRPRWSPRRRGPRRALPSAAAVGTAALLLASGCGSSPQGASSAASPAGHAVTVLARSLTGVGTVLVTSEGYTLYMFVPDDRRRVTCTGLCASYWPPLKLPSGYAIVAGPGVKPALFGSDADPAGGRVVTYNGWPLYRYASDIYPGEAVGQGLDLNGGYWYVMRPSGAPLTSSPS